MVTQSRKPAKTRVPRSASARKKKSRGDAIVFVSVRGLKGKGLLRLGKESKLELRDRLAMPRPLFSRIVNVSERTIAKVEATAGDAEKLKRPYNEVYRLVEELSDVVERESLSHWFQTPNEMFDGLKPVEIIERGEIDRLWNMVFQLRSGMPG